MAKKKEKIKLSEQSFSDSELDMIDWDTSSLRNHSHFFAPSGHPHNRYSTPLIVITTGTPSAVTGSGAAGDHHHYQYHRTGVLSSSGAAAAHSNGGSSSSANGAASPSPISPFPHSSSRSRFFVPLSSGGAPGTMNGHSEGENGGQTTGEASTSDTVWPNGRLYVNKDSLAHDLSFLANMPELCDVTFLVGEDRQPICAVRAILAARSR